MSRRKRTYKREVIPDPVFKDVLVSKLVNKIMVEGKKATAQRLFYGALDEIKTKIQEEEPYRFLKKQLKMLSLRLKCVHVAWVELHIKCL